jgi:hypothetical protein
MELRLEIPRLAALISLVATYHPRGLRVLLGDDPEPTLGELDEILRGISSRPDLGTSIESGRPSQAALDLVCRLGPVAQTIDRAGGWPVIADSARAVQRLEPLAWNLFAESVLWVGAGSKLNPDGGHQARIALRYGVSIPTVAKWRVEVPNLIARHALQGGQRVLCHPDRIFD